MARSFGEDKEEDGKRGSDSVPMQEGAGAVCNDGDEADLTEIAQASPYNPNTIHADAQEGRHLLLDFVRTEMIRNGMDDEVQCLDDQVDREERDMVDPERYCSQCNGVFS